MRTVSRRHTLVLYRSRVLEGDKQVNVSVGRQAHSRHFLKNNLKIYSVFIYTLDA